MENTGTLKCRGGSNRHRVTVKGLKNKEAVLILLFF